MKLYKLIEIDMEAIRKRTNGGLPKFTKHQRAALNKLYDLFEAGKWQKCLLHVNDKKAFPYNKKGEYPEIEHIPVAIEDVLRHLPHCSFFTQSNLKSEVLSEIREHLSKK